MSGRSDDADSVAPANDGGCGPLRRNKSPRPSVGCSTTGANTTEREAYWLLCRCEAHAVSARGRIRGVAVSVTRRVLQRATQQTRFRSSVSSHELGTGLKVVEQLAAMWGTERRSHGYRVWAELERSS
jgi:hypothetical protein